MNESILKTLTAKNLNVEATRVSRVGVVHKNSHGIQVAVYLTNGERLYTTVLVADYAAAESQSRHDTLPPTARIARWTDEGTHGMPDTVDVYLRKDGRYDVVRHHGGGLVGVDTVLQFPADASRHGRLRKVAM